MFTVSEEFPTSFETYLSHFLTENKRMLFDKVAAERTHFLTVVLEDVFQPQNASAVIRSCDCFGIQDVHIIENRNTYEINPNVVMGATKWIDMYKYNDEENNTINCINKLKQKGYKIVATTPHGNQFSLYDLPLDKPIALFFGTEKLGLSKEVIDHADEFVTIPMYGFTESFNISVSVALCLNVLSRKIREQNVAWQLSEEEQRLLKFEWTKRHLLSWELYEKEYNARRMAKKIQ